MWNHELRVPAASQPVMQGPRSTALTLVRMSVTIPVVDVPPVVVEDVQLAYVALVSGVTCAAPATVVEFLAPVSAFAVYAAPAFCLTSWDRMCQSSRLCRFLLHVKTAQLP